MYVRGAILREGYDRGGHNILRENLCSCSILLPQYGTASLMMIISLLDVKLKLASQGAFRSQAKGVVQITDFVDFRRLRDYN